MKLIFDAQALDLYRGWRNGGFFGGSETMVNQLAAGLASKGHTVHVVTPDGGDEQKAERLYYWGPEAHPTTADAVIMVPSIEKIEGYNADLLIVATNGIGHDLGGQDANAVDAFPVFSQTHADLLASQQGVDPAKCFITGLGVDLKEYEAARVTDDWCPHDDHWSPDCPDRGIRVPGRIMVGNDPQRGLWHVLDIFDKLRELVPYATLHVTYDCQKVFDQMRWHASHMATLLLDCERRLANTPGVTYLGALSRADLVREQLECQVHVWPSDPPNVGSQIHGITQMECAAAGAALVLSDIEAFPEVFEEAATILPLPGKYLFADEQRFTAEDWAGMVADLMADPEYMARKSAASRQLAEKHTWARTIDNWDKMLGELSK